MALVPMLVLVATQVIPRRISSYYIANVWIEAYGGFGFTSRMWGLTLDTITAVNAVLSNGTIITATNQQNSDLFWVRFYRSMPCPMSNSGLLNLHRGCEARRGHLV